MSIDFTVRTIIFLIAMVLFICYAYPWPRYGSALLGFGLAVLTLGFMIR